MPNMTLAAEVRLRMHKAAFWSFSHDKNGSPRGRVDGHTDIREVRRAVQDVLRAAAIFEIQDQLIGMPLGGLDLLRATVRHRPVDDTYLTAALENTPYLTEVMSVQGLNLARNVTFPEPTDSKLVLSAIDESIATRLRIFESSRASEYDWLGRALGSLSKQLLIQRSGPEGSLLSRRWAYALDAVLTSAGARPTRISERAKWQIEASKILDTVLPPLRDYARVAAPAEPGALLLSSLSPSQTGS